MGNYGETKERHQEANRRQILASGPIPLALTVPLRGGVLLTGGTIPPLPWSLIHPWFPHQGTSLHQYPSIGGVPLGTSGWREGVDERLWWFNPTTSGLEATALWGGTIPPHLRPSGDGVLRNEVVKDEEGTLP